MDGHSSFMVDSGVTAYIQTNTHLNNKLTKMYCSLNVNNIIQDVVNCQFNTSITGVKTCE